MYPLGHQFPHTTSFWEETLAILGTAALAVGGVASVVLTAGASTPVLIMVGSTVSGALIGASISGTETLVEEGNHLNLEDWSESLEIGAATGAISGAASGGASAITSALEEKLESVLAKHLLAMGMQGVGNAVGGAVSQIAANGITGHPWSEGVTEQAPIGALTGAASEGVARKIGTNLTYIRGVVSSGAIGAVVSAASTLGQEAMEGDFNFDKILESAMTGMVTGIVTGVATTKMARYRAVEQILEKPGTTKMAMQKLANHEGRGEDLQFIDIDDWRPEMLDRSKIQIVVSPVNNGIGHARPVNDQGIVFDVPQEKGDMYCMERAYLTAKNNGQHPTTEKARELRNTTHRLMKPELENMLKDAFPKYLQEGYFAGVKRGRPGEDDPSEDTGLKTSLESISDPDADNPEGNFTNCFVNVLSGPLRDEQLTIQTICEHAEHQLEIEEQEYQGIVNRMSDEQRIRNQPNIQNKQFYLDELQQDIEHNRLSEGIGVTTASLFLKFRGRKVVMSYRGQDGTNKHLWLGDPTGQPLYHGREEDGQLVSLTFEGEHWARTSIGHESYFQETLNFTDIELWRQYCIDPFEEGFRLQTRWPKATRKQLVADYNALWKKVCPPLGPAKGLSINHRFPDKALETYLNDLGNPAMAAKARVALDTVAGIIGEPLQGMVPGKPGETDRQYATRLSTSPLNARIGDFNTNSSIQQHLDLHADPDPKVPAGTLTPKSDNLFKQWTAGVLYDPPGTTFGPRYHPAHATKMQTSQIDPPPHQLWQDPATGWFYTT